MRGDETTDHLGDAQDESFGGTENRTGPGGRSPARDPARPSTGPQRNV
jgi:hypothetical protein